MILLDLGCCCTVRRSNRIPYDELLKYETVTGVKLNNGARIWFDTYGGEYVSFRQKIIGTTDGGEFVEIAIEEIETIKIGHRTMPHEQYFKTEPVAEVVLKTGDTIRFGRGGGEYCAGERLFKGTTDKGIKVEVRLDDVQFVKVKRVSGGWSLLATLTVFVVIPAAVLVAMLAQADSGNSNWW